MRRTRLPKNHKWTAEIEIPILRLKTRGYMARPQLPRDLWDYTHIPLIYFLFYKGSIIYIGQSTHLLNRLIKHLQGRYPKRKLFDYVRVINCPEIALLAEEKKYIKMFKPYLNKLHI